ncbi:MAG: MoxR family ATPase [Pseudomonadota bacterium]
MTAALDDLKTRLADTGFIADDQIAVAIDLSMKLERPLLLEGAAGVGKTEVAKALADMLGVRLIRLQCYEGLDAASAIYEWNYQRQLLAIKAHEGSGETAEAIEEKIFSETYLLKRPLLTAISTAVPPVLLIDEIDRADTEFEAYLLELLSDFQVSVPEIGTIEAVSRPHVILTSNGTRDLSDALRRRCLYSYVEFPDRAKELAILKRRVEDIEEQLARQIVAFVQALRQEDLEKVPGIAETLDWAAALANLDVRVLSESLETVQSTLICLLKTEHDLKAVQPEVTARLAGRAA